MNLFGHPKIDVPVTPNPADTQNRINDNLIRRLQSGGSQADTMPGSGGAPGASQAPRQPTLTGLN